MLEAVKLEQKSEQEVRAVKTIELYASSVQQCTCVA